jgi:hypothetical protein
MKANKMFKKMLMIGALVSVLPWSQVAYAANTDADLKLAQMLIQQGEPHKALDFLVHGLEQTSTNTEEWFLLGMAAKMSNRPRQARGYFEKVIALDPTHSGRAKLELAQLSYAIGDAERAKEYLTEVKATKPPAKVGDNIDQFLKQIDTQGVPRQWRLYASAGWLNDSNANAGPTINSVTMFGLPFILSKAAKKTHDNAVQLSLGLDHNINITDDMGWQSNLSANRTDYRKINTIDADVLSASSGPSLRLTDSVILSSPLVANWVKVGHKTSFYSYSYGVSPQLRYIMNKQTSLNIGTAFSKKVYHQSKLQGGYNYSLSPSIAHQFSPAVLSRVGVSIGKQKSDLKFYKYDFWAANAMIAYAFRDILQLSAHASYNDSLYAGKEAAYTQARHDRVRSFGADITYHIKPIRADILLSVNVTKSHSNLPIPDYVLNAAKPFPFVYNKCCWFKWR